MSQPQAIAADAAQTESQSRSKKPLTPRMRIARQILFYHFALIFISGIYYILKGFDLEEFTSLMGILAPITALYGGAVFRYIGRSITSPQIEAAYDNGDVSGMVKMLVNGHFIVVFLLISGKALAPNILNFQDMTIFLTLTESALGVYMGSIIMALFEGKKQEAA